MNDIFNNFFDVKTIPFYIIGILIFFISIIDDLTTTKKTFWWYLQDFLYSIVAVTLGISISYLLDLPSSAIWIVTICCAFVGSSIIRKIDYTKEKLSEKAIDRITEATIKKIEKKLNSDTENNENNQNEIL